MSVLNRLFNKLIVLFSSSLFLIACGDDNSPNPQADNRFQIDPQILAKRSDIVNSVEYRFRMFQVSNPDSLTAEINYKAFFEYEFDKSENLTKISRYIEQNEEAPVIRESYLYEYDQLNRLNFFTSEYFDIDGSPTGDIFSKKYEYSNSEVFITHFGINGDIVLEEKIVFNEDNLPVLRFTFNSQTGYYEWENGNLKFFQGNGALSYDIYYSNFKSNILPYSYNPDWPANSPESGTWMFYQTQNIPERMESTRILDGDTSLAGIINFEVEANSDNYPTYISNTVTYWAQDLSDSISKIREYWYTYY